MRNIAPLATRITTALVVVTLTLLLATVSASEPTKKGKLTHIGLIWLKNPGNTADRERIIAAAHRFAREIPEVQNLSVGQPHPSSSALVDASFDICLTMQFDDQAAMERYNQHPVHQKAAREDFLPLSGKLLFYDFVTQ